MSLHLVERTHHEEASENRIILLCSIAHIHIYIYIQIIYILYIYTYLYAYLFSYTYMQLLPGIFVVYLVTK
jgi:hypothetical protein